MRGEHDEKIVRDGQRTGSSPHARGAQTLSKDADINIGIIPACAGSTLRRRSPAC